MINASEHLIATLQQLPNLKFLDISLFNEKVENDSTCIPVMELLERTDILPDLEFLDLSGWKEFIPRDGLVHFIESHPKLEFIGR